MFKRRRTRWLLRAALLAVVAVPLVYLLLGSDGSAVRQAREELDAADPGWRLDDLLAAQRAAFPPAHANALVLADDLRPPHAADRDWAVLHADPTAWLPEDDPNQLPKLTPTAEVWCDCREWLDAVRRLRHTPTGGEVVAVPADPFDTRFVYLDTAGRADQILGFDALVSAAVGEPDRAIEAIHAELNVGRALTGPFPIEAAFRFGFHGRAVRHLERVLGLSEPTAGLAELQAVLLAEADAGVTATALRGARATADREFAALEDGSAGLRASLGRTTSGSGPGLVVDSVRYRPHVRADHVRTLRLYTALLEVARKPDPEWAAGVAAVPAPPDDDKHLMSVRHHGQAVRLMRSGLLHLANLRTAATAIACERFRQTHGRWPTALAELTPDLLPAVPTDPYDGRPLRYLRKEYGVAVYSVGPDGQDDGGQFAFTLGFPQRRDVGLRLFDPARRRAAPLTPAEAK